MIIYLKICEVNHEHYKNNANSDIVFLKPSRGNKLFLYYFLLLYFVKYIYIYIYIYYFMVFHVFFKKQFSYMNHQTLFSPFLQDKNVCNNWNLRLLLLLLHMSLFYLTIRKYVNFLGKKLIYYILRECMAFIISTWAPAQYFLAWVICW